MRWLWLLVLIASCTPQCGETWHEGPCICLPDAAPGLCDPLVQASCPEDQRCTWFISPKLQNVAYNRCVPDDGTAGSAEPCQFGVAGYDNCKKGFVCSNAGGVGECRAICQVDSAATCGSAAVCIAHPPLLTPSYYPNVAGICLPTCDPLADNDFDGSASAFTKSGTTCGSGIVDGCYALISFNGGENPVWHCDTDVHANLSLRHRMECSFAAGCADAQGMVQANSCNQGYVPAIQESTMVSTLVCVAICKPLNCYAGNCGSNDDNRLGEAPHRCAATDRVGTFDTSPAGEHCVFEWLWNTTVPLSPTHDTVGLCIDHAKYGWPPCASLPDGMGSGSAWGAADVGCVDSTHAGPFAHEPRALDDIRPLLR